MNEKYDISKGLSYYCDHHIHKANEYLDIGFVLWPKPEGHFGIVRYGTEVLIFNINNLMEKNEIQDKDILWYQEFLDPHEAYSKSKYLYTELEMILKEKINEPTIRFPTINNNIHSCEILQSPIILKMIYDCFKAYGEGFLAGNLEAFQFLFYNKEME